MYALAALSTPLLYTKGFWPAKREKIGCKMCFLKKRIAKFSYCNMQEGMGKANGCLLQIAKLVISWDCQKCAMQVPRGFIQGEQASSVRISTL